MSSSETISVYRIPTPASDDDVTTYSQIRLAALQMSPEAFSSNFAGASLFVHEQWVEIVNTPGRTTLLARGVTKNGTGQHEQWQGTVSVLHPEVFKAAPDSYPETPRDALAHGDLDRYLLVGMWVHPNARRKGVGKMLIRAALDLIESEPLTMSPAMDQERGGDPRYKVVVLRVHSVNHGAKALYASMGFVEEMGVEDGQMCTMSVMR